MEKTEDKFRKILKKSLEKLNSLESNLNSNKYRKPYNQQTADAIKIRCKCEWYEHGKKSTKFFLNLEKKHGIHNQVWKLIVKEKEITDPKEESNSIKVFYEKLFKQNYSKINVEK